MDKNFINIDLDDPRAGLVAEALSNKTCVKILSTLAEHELTAGDVSIKLGIPLNTTGYNIEKLMRAGLVEKSSNYFWSVKGKKTPVYKVVNKKIIISPKKLHGGFIPAVIITGVFAVFLRMYINSKTLIADNMLALPAAEMVSATSSNTSILALGWMWFVAGALFSLLIAFVWDWLSYKGVLK